MITVRTPTGDKAAATVTVRTPGGNKGVATMTLRTPTGDEVIFSSAVGGDLMVSVSPPSATGSTFNPSAPDISTNLVTVSVTGGTAPYLIDWEEDIGGSGTWSIDTPLAFSTRFTALGVSAGDSASTSFTGTVTDARGRTGSVTVPAAAYNFATGGL